MYKPLLILALVLGFSWTAQSQTVLEDFEDGGKLTWSPGDIEFAIVANPEDTTGRNASANVGQYKRFASPFANARADLDAPLDLSTNNQFSIQINGVAPGTVTLKLEGGDGSQNIEETKVIPNGTTGRWLTYEFDFSAAASADILDRIVVFFNITDGADTSTFFFDNLTVGPAGPCTGVASDPTIIDDFECQRNVPIGVPGLDDITIVENPDSDGNPSTTVARYRDTLGAFHALVYSNFNAFDLSENNQIGIKLWAPIAGRLLVKLEGGTSQAVEVGVDIPESDLMMWKEYTIDFSDQADRNHTRLVFFINAGVAAGENEIYFIDDITLTPKPEAPALEDFEDGARLSWMPLNDDMATHGMFNGVIENPAPDAVNDSPNIGSYTRASSNFSTLSAVLPNGIDLVGNPQLNLDVWAPAGATTVTLQLQSGLEGARSVEVPLTTNEAWETLSFDFSASENITDFGEVRILFDPNTDGTGTYFFDNLLQGESTVDACAGVEPIATFVDDFDCQRNIPTNTGDLAVIRNPDESPENNSLNVGQYTDPFDAFSALVYNFETPIDLSTNNQLFVQIWSPEIVPLGFKLEDSEGGAPPVEIVTNVTATESWVTYQIDFSDQAGTDFRRLVIFFNFGEVQTEQLVYFIDNIEFRRAPFTNDCVADFERPDLTLADWNYFANGDLGGAQPMVVENPDQSGINTSATVLAFEENVTDGDAGGVQPFAGAFTRPDAPIQLVPGMKSATMKVWMPVAGSFVFKVEGGIDGAPNSGDRFADYTTPMEWQELTFDFSVTQNGDPIPDGSQYGTLTIIPNFDVEPDMVLTHYIDDIAFAGGSCVTTSIFQPIEVEQLKVAPNPAGDYLQVFGTNEVHFLQIHNTLGQPVRTVQLVGQVPQAELDLSGLQTGMYVLTAYGANGQLIANSTFLKR